MSGDSSVTLNGVSVAGGQSAATYLDTAGAQHSKVVLEIQTGGTDPVKVSSGNPLPISVNTLPLPTGAAQDSSINGILVGQSATLAGKSGPLVQAAVVSGSQSFTAGNVNPLTQDTTGALRVNVVEGSGGGGTSIADGSAFTRGSSTETPAAALASTSAPTLTTGQIGVLSMDLSGQLRVLPNGNVASGATDSGNPMKIGGVYNSSAPTLTTGQRCDTQMDVNGNIKVSVTNGITGGSSSSPSTSLVSVTPQAAVSGGASRSSVRITSTANAVQTVKSSAGQLYSISVVNTTGTLVYLHFYDVSGSITLGTTADTDVYAVPYNSQGAGFVITFPMPLVFANKIAYAITGGVTTTDNTATTAAASTPITVNVGFA